MSDETGLSISALQVLVTSGGVVLVAFTGSLAYIHSRINRVEMVQRLHAERTTQEMNKLRDEAVARGDKVWDALESIRTMILHYQERTDESRAMMTAQMATKDDLHREIDKLTTAIQNSRKTLN